MGRLGGTTCRWGSVWGWGRKGLNRFELFVLMRMTLMTSGERCFHVWNLKRVDKSKCIGAIALARPRVSYECA